MLCRKVDTSIEPATVMNSSLGNICLPPRYEPRCNNEGLAVAQHCGEQHIAGLLVMIVHVRDSAAVSYLATNGRTSLDASNEGEDKQKSR